MDEYLVLETPDLGSGKGSGRFPLPWIPVYNYNRTVEHLMLYAVLQEYIGQ